MVMPSKKPFRPTTAIEQKTTFLYLHVGPLDKLGHGVC
jgi:hypothetical protein